MARTCPGQLPAGDVLTGHIAHLEELRIRAYEIRIEAKDELGQHRESIPELRRLINDYPLNEWFHSRLIAVLGATGRRAEALQAYQNVRRLLDDELGLEPLAGTQAAPAAAAEPGAVRTAHRDPVGARSA